MNAEELLMEALAELEKAVRDLLADTSPKVPLPRFRRFEFVPGRIFWPTQRSGVPADPLLKRSDPSIDPLYVTIISERGTRQMHSLSGFGCEEFVIPHIMRVTGGQPRLVLRALRRIQAATAWCQARAEGRRRQAEEILRQQARAVEALEAEAAIMVLGK